MVFYEMNYGKTVIDANIDLLTSREKNPGRAK